MFEGFNDAARMSVVDAQVYAYELGHDYVGVEHLLLGLLSSRSSASAVCDGVGLDLTPAKERVAELVGRRPPVGRGGLAVDRRVGEVLAGARSEAVSRRHRQITALHLGAAMFAYLGDSATWRDLDSMWGGELPVPRPPEGVAAATVAAAGLDAGQLRQRMIAALDEAVDAGVLEVARP